MDEIDKILDSSTNYSMISNRIDSINKVIDEDEREMFKTPILLYSETTKLPYYYWASEDLGCSGDGQFFLKNIEAKTVAKADGRAAAAGFIGLAAYGSWGVIFGPSGFALTGVAVGCVAVNAAIASALEALSN